jgi:hypothetical protein
VEWLKLKKRKDPVSKIKQNNNPPQRNPTNKATTPQIAKVKRDRGHGSIGKYPV